MGPVKKVHNNHENPYFPSSMKMQMSREPVSKERLHSGVSVMPEYNAHPTSCCCANVRHDLFLYLFLYIYYFMCIYINIYI